MFIGKCGDDERFAGLEGTRIAFSQQQAAVLLQRLGQLQQLQRLQGAPRECHVGSGSHLRQCSYVLIPWVLKGTASDAVPLCSNDRSAHDNLNRTPTHCNTPINPLH